MGSELRANEKAFIAFLGPRGIVAASVAAFFSLRLLDTGHVDGRFVEALVFAVILATVLIEGNAAGWLARVFKVMPQHIIIVGADAVGRRLAASLAAENESVSLIDTNTESLRAAANLPGVQVLNADATDTSVLKRAGAVDARCLVAATSSDKVNLLLCELARAAFRMPRLMALVTGEGSRAAFEAAGIEVVDPNRATADVLENRLLRPSLYRLLTEGGAEGIAEVEVNAPGAVGRTLADLRMAGIVMVALRRGDGLCAPNGKTRLLAGDIVTLLGDEDALDLARRRLHL
jgi:Trk K+ transport system NAD-binding subunit